MKKNFSEIEFVNAKLKERMKKKEWKEKKERKCEIEKRKKKFENKMEKSEENLKSIIFINEKRKKFASKM